MISYVVAVVIGGIVGYLIKEQEEEKEPKDLYWINLDSQKMGMSTLELDSYLIAKDMYDTIKKSGKVKVRYIALYDEVWNDIYAKHNKEGTKPSYPLTYEDKITSVELGYGKESFEKYKKK